MNCLKKRSSPNRHPAVLREIEIFENLKFIGKISLPLNVHLPCFGLFSSNEEEEVNSSLLDLSASPQLKSDKDGYDM